MSICRLVLVAAVTAGSATALSAQPRQPESTAAATMESPAERKMAIAKKKIDRDPKRYHGYNELALALTQRARETADPVVSTSRPTKPCALRWRWRPTTSRRSRCGPGRCSASTASSRPWNWRPR